MVFALTSTVRRVRASECRLHCVVVRSTTYEKVQWPTEEEEEVVVVEED